MGTLLTAGVAIAILWIACFIIYIVSSRQQAQLVDEIDSVKKQLEDETEGSSQ